MTTSSGETTTADPHHLARFAEAQEGVIEAARSEIAAGRKRSHWMWFVFPQIEGLGSSPMARRYALSGLAEARAYLAHPVLGPRLEDITELAVRHAEKGAHAVFGSPDDLKFRSCLTLFARAAGPESVFAEALAAFFGGREDEATLARLGEPVARPRR